TDHRSAAVTTSLEAGDLPVGMSSPQRANGQFKPLKLHAGGTPPGPTKVKNNYKNIFLSTSMRKILLYATKERRNEATHHPRRALNCRYTSKSKPRLP